MERDRGRLGWRGAAGLASEQQLVSGSLVVPAGSVALRTVGGCEVLAVEHETIRADHDSGAALLLATVKYSPQSWARPLSISVLVDLGQ